MSENGSAVEIVTDGDRRRRWSSAEKLRIVAGEEERGAVLRTAA